MSGGSLDYVCYKVEDAASILCREKDDPLFVAFGKHLKKVAKALHDVEWELSGDGAEDVDGTIRAVISPSNELQSATEEAEKALSFLQKSIEFAKSLNRVVKTTATNSE